MNEKIKLLAEQATVNIKDEFGHWINSEFDKEKLYNRMIVEEKNRKLNQFSLIQWLTMQGLG